MFKRHDSEKKVCVFGGGGEHLHIAIYKQSVLRTSTATTECTQKTHARDATEKKRRRGGGGLAQCIKLYAVADKTSAATQQNDMYPRTSFQKNKRQGLLRNLYSATNVTSSLRIANKFSIQDQQVRLLSTFNFHSRKKQCCTYSALQIQATIIIKNLKGSQEFV